MKKDLIYRKRYLERVRPFIGKSLIKVFTGQRRSRKKLPAISNYARDSG